MGQSRYREKESSFTAEAQRRGEGRRQEEFDVLDESSFDWDAVCGECRSARQGAGAAGGGEVYRRECGAEPADGGGEFRRVATDLPEFYGRHRTFETSGERCQGGVALYRRSRPHWPRWNSAAGRRGAVRGAE